MKASISLADLEIELKKSWNHFADWGKKQNNADDAQTNWIYESPFFEEVFPKIQALEKNLQGYALRRWYNFWSAKAVESMFQLHSSVKPAENAKDRKKDFYWNGIPFDHKTTVFPASFPHSVAFAQKNPETLVTWLYENQSTENRHHAENRFFVVVLHWKHKAELMRLHALIHQFLHTFSLSQGIKIQHNTKEILAGLIWAIF